MCVCVRVYVCMLLSVGCKRHMHAERKESSMTFLSPCIHMHTHTRAKSICWSWDWRASFLDLIPLFAFLGGFAYFRVMARWCLSLCCLTRLGVPLIEGWRRSPLTKIQRKQKKYSTTHTTTYPQLGWERFRSCRTHCPNGMRKLETFSRSCSWRKPRYSNERKKSNSWDPILTNFKVSFPSAASQPPFRRSGGAPSENLERSGPRVYQRSHRTCKHCKTSATKSSTNTPKVTGKSSTKWQFFTHDKQIGDLEVWWLVAWLLRDGRKKKKKPQKPESIVSHEAKGLSFQMR